jgi:hypothetical protein
MAGRRFPRPSLVEDWRVDMHMMMPSHSFMRKFGPKGVRVSLPCNWLLHLYYSIYP